jgi:hypothetical protein
MLANNLSLQQLAELRGRPVFARSGERIGTLAAVLYDDESGRAGWIGIRKGPVRRRLKLAPAGGIALRETGIRIPYSAAMVEAAPRAKRGSGEAIRMALYRHYHLSYPGYSYPVAKHADDDAVVHQELPHGAVRLRRWLESSEERRRVTVEREVLIVRRQPVFEPVDGVELGVQTAELTLVDEEPVVSTRVVARERVTVQSAHVVVREEPELVGLVPGPQAPNGKGQPHGDRQTA